MKKAVLFKFIILVTLSFQFTSCTSEIETIDITLADINKIYPADPSSIKSNLSDTLDIYLDYSACFADAVKNSPFFKDWSNNLVNTNHNLKTIKGMVIRRESSEKSKTELLMNNVSNVDYANIPGAFEDINKFNNQALLITDCEYVTLANGERANFAFFTHELVNWLDKNRVVYIMVEDYNENRMGKTFDKKRFYMLFTDDKLKDNYFTRFKNAGKLNPSNITIMKLNSSDAKIIRYADRLSDNFSFNSDTISDTELITIENSWEEIFKYTLPNSGNDDEELEEDESQSSYNRVLIKGLKVKSKDLTNYHIEDIELLAYNITDVFLDSIKNKKLEKPILSGFQIDEEAFKKHGEIVILMTEELINYLESDKENLIKIDIRIKDTEVKDISKEDFVWTAMIAPGNPDNISVYESIKQALVEPKVKPENRNNGLIYTIYLKTPEFK